MNGAKTITCPCLPGYQHHAPPVAADVEERIFEELQATGRWLARLYREKSFDNRENPDFIPAGKHRMFAALKMRTHMDLNPHFIFLHRTRYGLLRLFERMGARVSFRNPYEYPE
jgi:hypothetical protein